jgi:hypothetical protein
MVVSEDGFTLFRRLNNSPDISTGISTGAKSYMNGMHFWTIIWPGFRIFYPPFKRTSDQYATIGIISEGERALSPEEYENQLGSETLPTNSFGWDINNKVIFSNGKVIKKYPEDENYQTSGHIAMMLNMEKRTLAFVDMKQNKHLGEAVTNLEGAWSPAISSMFDGDSEIYLKYAGAYTEQPLSLEEICKRVINNRLKTHPQKKIHDTGLPNPLQKYLLAPYQTPLDGSDGEPSGYSFSS